MKWMINDLGRWTSEDSKWAIMPVGQDRWQIMYKVGEGQYAWNRIEICHGLERAKEIIRTKVLL